MAQNIYDNLGFYEKYSQLDRQVRGHAGAPEWSSVSALLPDLKDKRIIDLGCGFGWFCRYAMEQRAKSVTGIDISKNMISKAKSFPKNSTITYKIADLDEIILPKGSFDFAYSSLTFHYIKDFSRLMKTIYDSLTSKSHFVFTIEHPIYTAPQNQKLVEDSDGNQTWLLDSYQIEGERTSNWLVKGVIKYHRTMTTIIDSLIKIGFTLKYIEEWKPSEKQLKDHPTWKEEITRPCFLIISVYKD
ncbi:SAM-dependent methyltransferase [Microgenomates bacterium UTCPR1]|nr:MAG: SAM-dependent methyltransferase [Microgenomates bacterium UTCPR1]